MIAEELKNFTYCTCCECSSVHDMDYMGGDKYMCEECYRILKFNDAITNKDMNIKWKNVKKYIVNHITPKKVIKIFIVKILQHKNWENYDIDEIYNNLITENKLFGN
jgi:hypothetical protein